MLITSITSLFQCYDATGWAEGLTYKVGPDLIQYSLDVALCQLQALIFVHDLLNLHDLLETQPFKVNNLRSPAEPWLIDDGTAAFTRCHVLVACFQPLN